MALANHEQKSVSLDDCIAVIDQEVVPTQALCTATADLELQKKALATVLAAHDRLRAAKIGAMRIKHAKAADWCLGLQAAARGVAEELRMWIALRENRPRDAWTHLVEAEENLALVLRTPAGHDGTKARLARLEDMESVLFPKPTFMSIAFSHDGGKCSICAEPFSTCIHVEGRIYCGQVCGRVEIEHVTEVHHFALVEVPQDKRCIMTEIEQDDGTWIDLMTRAPIVPQPERPEGAEGWGAHGIFLTDSPAPGVSP